MASSDKSTAPHAPHASQSSAFAPGHRQRADAHDVVVVLGNAPDMLLAKRIAHVLVEEGLVACATLGAPCLSMYMWEGTLEGSEEIPLMLKTTGACVPTLIARLQQLHPDSVPQILVLPVSGGAPNYLNWVDEQTKGPSLADG